MLSMYVLKSVHENQPILYNTINKKWLPEDASEKDLRDNLFLEGQERQAMHSVFAENRNVLGLIITPTWECNLRCKHCSVINNLKLREEEVFPVDKLFAFLNEYIDLYHPKYITLDFVGGEPLLRPKVCVEIMKRAKTLDAIVVTDTTTNLSVELDEDCFEFFDLIDSINISIDGDEAQHNSQRIPLNNALDPYQKTHSNLELLLDHGLTDKISLKAALKDDFITKEGYEAFLTKYAYMGISIDKIKYGCLHPTEHIKPTYNEMIGFKNSLISARPIPTPCCKYRALSVFQIEPTGDIYDVPFRWAKSKVGTLDQPVSEMVANRQKQIEASFVCFQDEKCMKCPVIGFCWGGCVTGLPMNNGKPSEHCNQERLIAIVNKMAAEGEIVKQTDRQKTANILDSVVGRRIPLECLSN